MKTIDHDTGFRAVTYNVLAQAYVKPSRYRGVAPEALEPSARRARLQLRVEALQPDVLCAQEVEPEVFDLLRGVLPRHQAEYAQRNGRPDGVATFVNPARLRVTARRVLHYAACDPGYDHLALVLRMQSARGRPLAVANTHLRWQPADTPPPLHQGLLQMQELIADLEVNEADRTWLVAGDLNATSQSPVIDHARRAGLDLAARSQRPWDTAMINGNRRKLDYLLHHADALRPAPGSLPALTRAAPIPSATEPSDHLPLQVDFDWC